MSGIGDSSAPVPLPRQCINKSPPMAAGGGALYPVGGQILEVKYAAGLDLGWAQR